jgi:hypothetical protein
LIYRKQATITVETQKDHFSNKDLIDLDEAGFKIAFGVMDYDNGTRIDNTDFVKWNVYLEERKDLFRVN